MRSRWVSLGLAGLLCANAAAHAVVVRGVVSTPLGVPVPGARVQLILGQKNVADSVSGFDGTFEIRSDLSGRFVLLTSARVAAGQPAVQVSQQFFGGRTDVVRINVAIEAAVLTPPVTSVATGRETPLAQLSTPVGRVESNLLLTRELVGDALAETLPGVVLVVQGQTGSPATLYLRGAAPEATGLRIDGVDAERVGGGFDAGTLGAAGLAAIGSEVALELEPGADPLRGSHGQAGLLTLHTASAAVDGLRLVYAGDAGPLDTVRQEATATYTRRRLDLLGSFARFDTSNDVPASPFHEASSNANLGYQVTANTSLRLTLREDVSAAGLPSPFGFYGVQPQGRLAAQNLAAGATYETRTERDWHTLVRYGLERDRQQIFDFFTPATGLPVTITGANGASVSGVADFIALPGREDLVSNRDEYAVTTDYAFKPYLQGLLTAQYEDERAADLLPLAASVTHPTTRSEQMQLNFAGSLQGDIRHRVFYQASGLVDFGNDAAGVSKLPNTLGLRGAPRAGLSWAPLRAGRRRLSGTTLHATAATSFREPTLAEQTAFPASVAIARSRSFDAGISQNLVHQKLTTQITYFHAQYAHQTELLAPETTVAAAGLSNQLAYRAQGLEAVLRYRPVTRLRVEGGYTYLAAEVEQTAATAVFNPLFAGTPIGVTTALAGQRPFHRPPQSGFATAEFIARTVTATVSAQFAGRSDDSTALVLTPGLLLPNRNLAPGYVRVDASFSYEVNHHIVLYTQLNNLADNRHIAPAGYVSAPLVARSGLRILFGRGL